MVTTQLSAAPAAPVREALVAPAFGDVPKTYRATDRRVVVLALVGMAGTVAVALAAAALVHRVMPADIGRADVSAWATFFTVFGVIYAIVAGLLIAELLGRYHRLSKVVQDELNAIEDVRDFLVYVDGQPAAKQRVHTTLLAYVVSVAHREWRQMAKRRRTVAIDTDTSPELYEVMRAVQRIEVRDHRDEVALAALIGRLAEITTFRTERLHMSGQHLSPAIKALVAFMSGIVITGFVLMAVGSIWIQNFMVLSAAIAVYLLLAVIADLHYPFDGMWRITRAPFLSLIGRLERRIAATPPVTVAQADRRG